MSPLAKHLLQVIVGSGQPVNVVAVEQARPITARDFEEMVDAQREIACLGFPACHCTKQSSKSLPNGLGVLLRLIVENRGGLVYPGKSSFD